MFVILPEIVGYLFPQCFLLGIYSCLFGISRIFFEPAAIPVNIQDSIHIIIHAIINHFFYPCQPGNFDFISCLIFQIAVPCTWNTNGIKSGGFYGIYQCFCGFRISPGSFASRCFKCIAQIPAQCHFFCQHKCVAHHTGYIVAFSLNNFHLF